MVSELQDSARIAIQRAARLYLYTKKDEEVHVIDYDWEVQGFADALHAFRDQRRLLSFFRTNKEFLPLLHDVSAKLVVKTEALAPYLPQVREFERKIGRLETQVQPILDLLEDLYKRNRDIADIIENKKKESALVKYLAFFQHFIRQIIQDENNKKKGLYATTDTYPISIRNPDKAYPQKEFSYVESEGRGTLETCHFHEAKSIPQGTAAKYPNLMPSLHDYRTASSSHR
jgi:hypothetical protein